MRAGRAPPAASRRGARGGGSNWLRGVAVIYFGWAARAWVPRVSRVWIHSWSRSWWGGEGAASTEARLNRGPRKRLWVGKINNTQDNRKKSNRTCFPSPTLGWGSRSPHLVAPSLSSRQTSTDPTVGPQALAQRPKPSRFGGVSP